MGFLIRDILDNESSHFCGLILQSKQSLVSIISLFLYIFSLSLSIYIHLCVCRHPFVWWKGTTNTNSFVSLRNYRYFRNHFGHVCANMGNACFCAAVVDSTVTSSTATKTTLPEFHPRNTTSCSPDHDPLIHDLVRRLNPSPKGQYHLLYKKGKQASTTTVSTARTTSTTTTIPASTTTTTTTTSSTRLVQRRVKPDGVACIGTSGTHIYAIRYPKDAISEQRPVSEQCPVMTDNEPTTIVDLTKDPYVPASMIVPPRVPGTCVYIYTI